MPCVVNDEILTVNGNDLSRNLLSYVASSRIGVSEVQKRLVFVLILAKSLLCSVISSLGVETDEIISYCMRHVNQIFRPS